MYRIAICENKLVQMKRMEYVLKQIAILNNFNFEIIFFESGEQLLKETYNEFDLIILSIEIGKLNGIQAAKNIRKTNKDIKIIFIADLDKYWIEGYSVNAYHYMIRPINIALFSKVIVKLVEECRGNYKYVLIKDKGILKKINVKEIQYLAIEGRKVILYTWDQYFETNISMQKWQMILINHPFVNAHKSYLVNLRYVKVMDKDKVELTTGKIIYISKRRYKEFKEKFVRYIQTGIAV